MEILDVFIRNKLKINYSYKNCPIFLWNIVLVWIFFKYITLGKPKHRNDVLDYEWCQIAHNFCFVNVIVNKKVTLI